MKIVKLLVVCSLLCLWGCDGFDRQSWKQESEKTASGTETKEDDNEGTNLPSTEFLTISYTDDPENSYFLIRAEDERIDGQVAFVNWSNSDQNTKATDMSDGLANTREIAAKVTKLWKFPAFQFAFDLNAKDQSVTDGGGEWFLPSRNELFLMQIFSGCLNLSAPTYWSSTELVNNHPARIMAWFASPNVDMSGTGYTYKIDGKSDTPGVIGAAIRLVKDNLVEGRKYPYVKSAAEAIIVCRDREGGVRESALRGDFPLAETTDIEDNGVSRCFEVDLTDAGVYTLDEAKALCTTKGKGWRVPTLRELELIWAMGGLDDDYTYKTETDYTGSWASYVPKGGLNLRDVEGFVPLDDTGASYLQSNQGYHIWEGRLTEYRFYGKHGRPIAGNPKGSDYAVRLVRDVEID